MKALVEEYSRFLIITLVALNLVGLTLLLHPIYDWDFPSPAPLDVATGATIVDFEVASLTTTPERVDPWKLVAIGLSKTDFSLVASGNGQLEFQDNQGNRVVFISQYCNDGYLDYREAYFDASKTCVDSIKIIWNRYAYSKIQETVVLVKEV